MRGSISLRAVLVLSAAVAILGLGLLAFGPVGTAQAATYYWDNDGTTAGFGTAGGTWAAPTTGDSTQGWSTSATGVLLPGNVTTATTDTTNFGNDGATGLGAGTITVSGTVSSGNMTFASGSGAIALSGGTITLAAAATITVDNTSDTIGSVLGGATTSMTKAGAGTLTLTGANTYTGLTTIANGVLELQHAAFTTTARAYDINSDAVLNVVFDWDYDNVPIGTTTFNGAGTLRFTGGFWCEGGGRYITMALGSGGLIDVPAGSELDNGGWWTATWTENLADLNVDGRFNIWDGHNPFIDALTGAGTVLRGHGKVGPDSPVTVLTVGVDNGSGTFSGDIVLGYYGTPLNVVKTGSGTQILTGTNNNYKGELSVSAGTLVVGGAGAFTAISGITVNGPTAAFMQNSSVANSRTFTLTQGTLGGTGTISTPITIGPDVTIAPGDRTLATAEAGVLTIANAVNLLDGGTTEMRLFSPTGSDALLQSTTGGLTYGGILKVIDLNPTDFAIGNHWELFYFDSQSGTFSNDSDFGTVGGGSTYLPLLTIGKKWSFNYTTGVLSVALGLIPGDADKNGVVDAADYITVKQNFGMTTGATWEMGNFDSDIDGNVDWDDLQLLMANFGTRSVGGAPATPEPATLGLLAIGALAVLRRRRRA